MTSVTLKQTFLNFKMYILILTYAIVRKKLKYKIIKKT